MSHKLIPLSEMSEWELVDPTQDIRGWPMIHGDVAIGTVSRLYIDPEREVIELIELDDGTTYRADDVVIDDEVVFLRSPAVPAEQPTRGHHRTRLRRRPVIL